MDEVALETTLSGLRAKRQRRIRLFVFVLMGLVGAGWLAVVALRIVNVARAAASREELARLVYPAPPDVPGVYPVATRPHPSFGGTILFTPEMPLVLDGAAGAPARLKFEVGDFLEGTTTRVEPLLAVGLTIYGPPNSWPRHGGHTLTLSAEGETMQFASSDWEYSGDGWGLKEQDRLDFRVPTVFLVRMGNAKVVTGSLDGESFTLTADELTALRDFAAYLRPGVEVRPPK